MLRAALLLLTLLTPASPVAAHIVYGKTTLHQLVAGSALVVRARIVDAHDAFLTPTPPVRRPAVRAQSLEVLKGEAAQDVLRFAQHGHGVAEFANGEEVLLFLLPIERSRELAALRSETDPRFVSLQEHAAKFLLTASNREPLLSAVRAYVALENVHDADARRAALRAITRKLLRSGQTRLASTALSDLVASGAEALGSSGALDEFVPLLHDRVLALGPRVGLLSLLELRGLPDAASHWLELLHEARGPEGYVVIRAAGGHPSPAVSAELSRLVTSRDVRIAAEAAVALGAPGHRGAEPCLARALEEGEPRLRMAAIRGLGGIASPKARKLLERASASHRDAVTRRRARAELHRLSGL